MSGRRWLMLLLGLTLVRGLIYAAVIPPWQAPDETGHFEYAWLIARLGRLPAPEDVSPTFEREFLGSLYEWRYGEFIGRSLPQQMPARVGDLPSPIFVSQSRTVLAGRFSLAYLWQAVFLLPFRYQDLVFQMHIARLSSVFLNVAITWLAGQTFLGLLLSRHRLAFLMTAVVVFLPQHTFINSMVGDGPLAELMACLVLYCWVRLFRHGLRVWGIVGLVLGACAGIWSKTTAAFLIPVNIGLAIWWLVRRYRQSRFNRRHLIYLCASVVLFGTGIWLWIRFSHLGAQTVQSVCSLRQALSPPELLWMDVRGLTVGEALLATYDSFWANFGWMALPVSGRWYGAIALFSIIALIGWICGRSRDVPSWAVGMMGGTAGVALAIFVWAAILSQSGYYQFQGRYLFPVLVPYAFLLVGGLRRLIPALERRYGMALFLLFLVGFDTWCLVGYILPYFVRG
jgi:hypothetical protein